MGLKIGTYESDDGGLWSIVETKNNFFIIHVGYLSSDCREL